MEWRLNHVGQMAQSVQDYSLKAVGYEIFDILNDMLLGKITVYQKEILIEKLKLVEKFLNM